MLNLIGSMAMRKEHNQVNEKILKLSLEIIYLLTGEEYAVRKTPWGGVRNGSNRCLTKGHCRTLSPFTVPPPLSLERKDQKILELTNAIIQLLTGEIPVRCEDVIVSLSMKEENVKGHCDHCKGAIDDYHQPKSMMTENHQPLGSQDISRRSPSNVFSTPVSLSNFDTKETPEKSDQEKYRTGNHWFLSQSPCTDVNLKNSTSIECPFPSVESNLQEERNVIDRNDHYELPEDDRTDPSTNVEVPASCKRGTDIDLIRTTKHRPPQYESAYCEEDEALGEADPDTAAGQHASFLTNDASASVKKESQVRPNNHTPTLYRSTYLDEVTSFSGEHVLDGGSSPAAGHESGGHSNTSPYAHETNSVLANNSCDETCTIIIKEESVSGEGDLTEDIKYDANYIIIKKESFSSDGDLTDTDTYSYTEHTDVKCTLPFSGDESASCEEMEVMDTNVNTRPDPTGLYAQQCSECGKICDNKSAYVSHQGKHTIDRMYGCPDCRKYFMDSDMVDNGSNLSCALCKASSTCKANLLRHYKLHLQKELIPCSECRKKYTNKYNLVTHRRVAVPKDQLSCSECGKSFASNFLLLTHKTIHTGEKPFSCSTCGKRFNRKGNLVRHQVIHSNEKNFSCSECGACFSYKSSLLTHHLLHTGKKPFSCPECGKGFTTNSDLVKHRRIHTGEKPFACSTCGKRFNKKANFIRHQIIHTGDKKFSCPTCGKCLSNKPSLAAHQLTHT